MAQQDCPCHRAGAGAGCRSCSPRPGRKPAPPTLSTAHPPPWPRAGRGRCGGCGGRPAGGPDLCVGSARTDGGRWLAPRLGRPVQRPRGQPGTGRHVDLRHRAGSELRYGRDRDRDRLDGQRVPGRPGPPRHQGVGLGPRVDVRPDPHRQTLRRPGRRRDAGERVDPAAESGVRTRLLAGVLDARPR